MPITIACPCGKKLVANDQYAGKRIRCPVCQQPVSVPNGPRPVTNQVTEAGRTAPMQQSLGRPAAESRTPLPQPGRISQLNTPALHRRRPWLWVAAVACLAVGLTVGGAVAWIKWSSSNPPDALAVVTPTTNLEPADTSPTPKEERPESKPEPKPSDPPAKKEEQPEVPIPEKPKDDPQQEQPPAKEKPPEQKLPEPKVEKPPKPPEPQNRVDAVIQSVIGVKSKKYDEEGYRNYTFGTTDKEIDAKTPLKKIGFLSPYLSNDQGEEFLFHEHKLVGIAKTYKGDNTGYLDKLKDLFGTAPKEDIDEWKVVNANAAAGQPFVEFVSDVFYFFPRTIALVRVVKSRFAIANTTKFREDEKVVVLVLSRSWVTAVLRDDIERKQAALKWLKETTAIAREGAFDPKKWPALPETLMKEEPSKARMAVYYYDQKTYDAELASFKAKSAAKPKAKFIFDPPATCMIDQLKQDAPELKRKKDSVAALFRFNRFDPEKPFIDKDPGGGSRIEQLNEMQARHLSRHPLLQTAFSELVGKLNSPLVQEQFPPQKPEIIVKRDKAVREYEWQTKDGWRVIVKADDTIMILQVDNDL